MNRREAFACHVCSVVPSPLGHPDVVPKARVERASLVLQTSARAVSASPAGDQRQQLKMPVEAVWRGARESNTARRVWSPTRSRIAPLSEGIGARQRSLSGSDCARSEGRTRVSRLSVVCSSVELSVHIPTLPTRTAWAVVMLRMVFSVFMFFLEPAIGFEPTTPRLQGERSTVELYGHA